MKKNIELKKGILTIKQEFPIRIGFLPDIHAGATRAVCTPTYEDTDAGGLPQTKPANEAQLMLYELWVRNAELFKKHDVQYIFVVGDAFAGKNPAEAGAYVFIDLAKQVELAADLLQVVWEILDNKEVEFFVWSGTGYHEARLGDQNMHEQLVKELRSRGIPARYMAQCSYVELHGGKDTLTGKPRMRRLFVAHEAPTAIVYPVTLMSRDIQWASKSGGKTTLPVDAIIRAHLHTWLHVDQEGIHAVQLPCWQGHTPYKATIRYFFKLQPTLGGAMMLMDEYGRMDFWGGSYPFGFTKKEYLTFHKLCLTTAKLKPPRKVERKCLS